jgi:hypothetical protein
MAFANYVKYKISSLPSNFVVVLATATLQRRFSLYGPEFKLAEQHP